MAVAAVGAEGVIGLGAVLGMRHYAQSPVTLVHSHGYCVSAERLLRVFRDSGDSGDSGVSP